MISSKVKDRTGQRFDRLIVIKFSHIENTLAKNAVWICLCDCGNFTKVRSSHLVAGTVRSCGCLAAENSRKRIKETHNKGKHLYIAECAGYYKIGRSDDPVRRCSDIQADNPLPVTLVAVYENKGHMEKDLHIEWCLHHHRGEWFKLPDGCEIVDLV